MSPSAVDAVPQVVEEVVAKTLPIITGKEASPVQTEVTEVPAESLEVKPLEEEAPQPEGEIKPSTDANGTSPVAAGEEADGVLPKRLDDHKEPLKLSGVLDQFTSFDVTPVIGREFVGVDLVKWLRAPNSDELLRDLAITS